MNKFLKGLSLSIVFSIASLMTPQVFAEVCGVVTTNKMPLNIRASASQTSKVISKAAKGSALRILNTRGAWYQVKLNNGKKGYGSIDYIRELTPRSFESCGIVITNQTSLNIRKRASQTSKVISKAAKGSALRLFVLDEMGAWFQVKLNNGKIGYAHSDYVKELF
jgi:uncharacterized protein YgiM (DUF1202 family)